MDNKEKQYKRQNKYVAEKYDRFTATFAKGQKEVYRKHAESMGKSLNGFINDLLENELKKEGEE